MPNQWHVRNSSSLALFISDNLANPIDQLTRRLHLRIPVDRKSKAPLFRQIELHLRQSIIAGSLTPDTRLPATRQLAAELGINRITVENAYAALEADGLVHTKVGSGTYVAGREPDAPFPLEGGSPSWPLWQEAASARMEAVQNDSALGMLRAAGHPRPICFSAGISDSRLFPADDFRRALQAVMRRDGISALDYGEHAGFAPLRATIAHVLASQGLSTRPECILVTAGSQQAISLVSQLLLKPGDTVLVESPTHAGALDLFRALGFQVVGVPVDEQGMETGRLERLLQRDHPRLIYTIPSFHNPTGACLGGPRRRELLALADRYNTPILEDDFVGDLRYDGRALPSLKALDPAGRVIHVGTFSKMLMPGLRIGFVVADGPVYDSLVRFKRVNDLATSTLIQRALEAYVTVGRYQAHLRRCCRIFRQRRDAMVDAIESHLPAGVRFSQPHGGLFVWLHLPEGLSAEELLPLACAEGVDFAPGRAFFPDSAAGHDCMRLNFVIQSPEDIAEGMRRLGAAIGRLR
jgi:GntR family transcriptional regulator / MocR family aminotransferase